MNISKWLILVVGLLLLASGFLFIKLRNLNRTARQPAVITDARNADCKPTFADGGGPYYKPNSPFRYKIVPDVNNGERLTVWGKVLQSDCTTPVVNATLDIWQANETGNYHDEWYRGQIKTNENGDYSFETVIPKGYGEGTGYRPPHIHFKVFVNGREVITSQMFFPEVAGTPGFDDAFIMKVQSTEMAGKNIHTGNHDIILP